MGRAPPRCRPPHCLLARRAVSSICNTSPFVLFQRRSGNAPEPLANRRECPISLLRNLIGHSFFGSQCVRPAAYLPASPPPLPPPLPRAKQSSCWCPKLGRTDESNSPKRVAEGLTPDQIAEAKRLAREWMAKHQRSRLRLSPAAKGGTGVVDTATDAYTAAMALSGRS